MGQHNIQIVPEWQPEPDVRLWVLALIALARQLEDEVAAEPQPLPKEPKQKGGDHD